MIFLPFKNENDTMSVMEVKVFFHETNETKQMPLEDYLLGVLMAEMPAEFEFEALKAQAVAARTYTLNKIKNQSDASSHVMADICTDFSHCQAYISEKEYEEKANVFASKHIKKFKNAIMDTKGEVMTYNDEPIKAVFHSTSSGKTENASDVWVGEADYLVSVDSPGEELSPTYKSEKKMSVSDFKTVFEKYDVDFSTKLFGNIKRSEGGAVKTIEIGNKTFKGTEIREILDLRSSCFEITATENEIVVHVTGNGHGVGMSQYGANYLASEGSSYIEILKRYYTGVKIINIYE